MGQVRRIEVQVCMWVQVNRMEGEGRRMEVEVCTWVQARRKELKYMWVQVCM